MLVSTIVATLFGNGSNSTVEQSYLVALVEVQLKNKACTRKLSNTLAHLLHGIRDSKKVHDYWLGATHNKW